MQRFRLQICWFIITVLAFGSAGCNGDSAIGVTDIPEPTMIPSQMAEPNAVSTRQPSEIRLGYTYQRSDGNRYLPGRGSLPEVAPFHIPLGGRPIWLVAAPAGYANIWVAVLEDGSVQAFSIADDQVQDHPITPGKLQPGMPPLLMLTDGGATMVSSLDANSSNLTSPVLLQPSGNMAYIRSNGDLVVRIGGRSTVLPLNALPDARLLTDEDERLLLLTGATGNYSHGVWGTGSKRRV